MKSVRVVVFFGAAALASHTPPARAQQVATPAGLVEFVGLHRWTVAMIQDSMRVHAPREPLGQCAAVLRSLGFASAQSLTTVSDDGARFTLVIVVEPQDSQFVRRRLAPIRGGARPQMWAEGYRILSAHNSAFQAATQHYGIHAVGDNAGEGMVMSLRSRDSGEVRAMWRFLDSSRGHRAERLAARVLVENSNFEDRMLAAAILGAQRGNRQAWYALAKGLRDTDERVAGTSEQALRSLSIGATSAIDWRPAREDLRAIVGGTNVLALRTTLVALTQTRIEPALARALLRNNGSLVLDLLASHSKEHREAAHNFLVLAAEKDLGMSSEPWLRWLASAHSR